MPRCSRVKGENCMYHIITKSISELSLFRDEKDKEKYMEIIKICQCIYLFKVYAYCLMNNHTHFIIDSNGADISKIMQSINLRYVMYYNKKYHREGHLFKDRFKSKIVTNERYLLTLSAYIHNNLIDINFYRECPEKYIFSSLRVYIGYSKDEFEVLDKKFIMQLFGNNIKESRKRYYNFIFRCDDKNIKYEVESLDEKSEYRSEKKQIIRNISQGEVISFVANRAHIDELEIYVKNNRYIRKLRAISILLMRCFCNLKCNDICKALGNITASNVSNLCTKGVELLKEDKYKSIVTEFLETHSA